MTANDPAAPARERLARLRPYLEAGLPEFTAESNNHIHTIYSFSPYTPTMAALRGRQAGLQVVGSVDHDSIAAADEMRAAGAALGMGVVTGFECRAMLHSLEEVEAGTARFADRKLNSPDSLGVAYLTVQAIPESGRGVVEEFLAPLRAARLERTRLMAERANAILASVDAPTFDWRLDVVERSQYVHGGSVTERHLLYAMANAIIAAFGRGVPLIAGLTRMGVQLSETQKAMLRDTSAPYLAWDLLGILKAEYLEQFYIQPDYVERGGELPDARAVLDLAERAGAIACYAYLGDVTASPTGDKKAEHFEDAYLDDLVDYLVSLGFPAITYMPPRNSAAQLERVSALCAAHGLIEVSGVDINQPHQSFSCPELAEPRFAHLGESTWALVAHEVLANDGRLGLLSPENPLASLPIMERVSRYAGFGRRLVAGESVQAITREIDGGMR